MRLLHQGISCTWLSIDLGYDYLLLAIRDTNQAYGDEALKIYCEVKSDKNQTLIDSSHNNTIPRFYLITIKTCDFLYFKSEGSRDY
jgi:hypothetical protein